MNIQENVSLSQHSTMRLGGQARYLVEVFSREDVATAADWAAEHDVEVLMIGGGSNIVWRDEGYDGLIVVNQIAGYQDAPGSDDDEHLVTIGGGENWDLIVERTVAAGLTGIEALSLIPGTAGATPIQNVGAYGQEIADTLVSVDAYDLQTRQFVTIAGADCGFGYRTSRFKTTDHGRYLICSITLQLFERSPAQPFYRAVADYFAAHDINEYTPAALRQAVVDIRSHKLPDPTVVANNGSFFANPIIAGAQLDQLLASYPDMPHWLIAPIPGDDSGTPKAKIPAAWLIEQAGFKDFHDDSQGGTGMATWHSQPLVLVNETARSTADLLRFKQMIVDAVQSKFQITLEQEPELLP